MKALLPLLICMVLLSTAAAQTSEPPGLFWAKNYGANRRVGEGQNPSLIALDKADNVYIVGSFSGTVDFDPSLAVAERTSAGAFDAYLLKLDHEGDFQWVHQFGGSGADRASAVGLDGSGHVYITGSFNGTVDFDPGPAADLRTAQGNPYLTRFGSSTYSQNSYIVKLTTDGRFVRAITIPGSEGGALSVDPSGDLILLGSYGASTESPIDFDPGPESHLLSYPDSICCGSYLLKLDSAGNYRWALHLGVGRSHRGIATDAAGNIYLAGLAERDVRPDFDPGPGDSLGTPSDPFIVKLDGMGRFRWGRQIGTGDRSADFFNMALEGSRLHATGYFENTVDFDPGAERANLTSAGSYDIFLLTLDTAGNYAGAVRFGGSGTDLGSAVVADSKGAVYLGGVFEDTLDVDPGPGVVDLISQGGDDGFVIKLGSAGDFLWSYTVGARNDRDTLEDHDQVYGLALGSYDHIFIDGMFNDTVDFDPCEREENRIASRPQESFMVRLHPFGCDFLDVPQAPSADGFSLAPNPATRSAVLTVPRNVQVSALRLLDIRGEVVREWKEVREPAFAIDLNGEPAGVYFVEVVGADRIRHLRLVVR